MASKWPENGPTEETLCDSAWRFEEIRRRSTSPMAQVRLPRVGTPSWCLRRSLGSSKKEDLVSYNVGEGVSGLGERVERREKGIKFCGYYLSLDFP